MLISHEAANNPSLLKLFIIEVSGIGFSCIHTASLSQQITPIPDFLTRSEKQLEETVPQPMLRESLTRLWFFSEQLKHAQGEERNQLRSWVVMEQILCGRLCPTWREGYAKVDELLASGTGQ